MEVSLAMMRWKERDAAEQAPGHVEMQCEALNAPSSIPGFYTTNLHPLGGRALPQMTWTNTEACISGGVNGGSDSSWDMTRHGLVLSIFSPICSPHRGTWTPYRRFIYYYPLGFFFFFTDFFLHFGLILWAVILDFLCVRITAHTHAFGASLSRLWVD